MNTNICPKCGAIAEYDEYYGRIVCTGCEWISDKINCYNNRFSKHKIIAIVVVDNNWAIGKNNDLLYHIPEDMEYFKKHTLENIVLYGYNTLLSFPKQKPLPNRTNIVLFPSDLPNEDNGITVAHNIEHLKTIIDRIDNDKPVFVCGGASVYSQLLEFCDEAYVTKVDASTSDATAFFPNLDKLPEWFCYETSDTINTKNGYKIKFCKYKKLI